jgi:hypothetical protein
MSDCNARFPFRKVHNRFLMDTSKFRVWGFHGSDKKYSLVGYDIRV